MTLELGLAPPAIDFYVASCKRYGVETDSGVLAFLRFPSRTKLRVSRNFTDKGLLPVADILILNGHIRKKLVSLDLSQASLTSNGAVIIYEMLKERHAIEDLNLANNCFGAHGARAIAQLIVDSTSLKTLDLRKCNIGPRGGKLLAQRLLEVPQSTPLSKLDLSLNFLGFDGVTAIESAIATAEAHISCDLHGNNLIAEVMNSATHCVGFIFCIIGSVFMAAHTMERARQEPDGRLPHRHLFCVTVYCVSLIVLYVSSTLYHSFFALPVTRKILSIFDHSAIYILIAGSYTPFLGLCFADKPMWSFYLLIFMWVCCFGGIYVEFTIEETGFCLVNMRRLSTAMYLTMGWMALITLPDLLLVLHSTGVKLLFAGGVFYTGGIFFFFRDRGMDHAIWHVFVLAGSMCHFACVYSYVIPFF